MATARRPLFGEQQRFMLFLSHPLYATAVVLCAFLVFAGLGSGYAAAQAAHPLPGTWSVVVSENGRQDSFGMPHDTPERFHASLSTYRSIPYGTLSPLLAIHP